MRERTWRAAAAGCGLLTALGWTVASATGVAADTHERPELKVEPSTIEADSNLTWRLALTLTNPLGVPIVADSGRVVLEDLGGGERRDSGTSELPLSSLASAPDSLPPGGSRTMAWTFPAFLEKALLTFEIEAHDPKGSSYRLSAVATASPGLFARQHPSESLLVDGRRVEVVFVAPADSSPHPAPAVLLVHGHGHHARDMLRSALLLSRAGFAVMCVSQPGYGLSDGPPDFMGPRTIAAASAALDRLGRSPGVDSTRLAAWGVSRGATVVALLMTRRPDLRAGVAQAGIYDMWAEYRGTKFDGIRANLVTEAGRDSSSWRERSAAFHAGSIKGRVLILHGEDDPNVPVGQAKAFYAELKSLGTPVEAEFFPGSGHALPRDQAGPRAIDFLRRSLAP